MKLTFAACAIFATALCASAAETTSTNVHTALVGQHVLELFQTQEAVSFGKAMGSTNPWNRKQVIASAQHMLAQGSRLKVDRDHVRFRIKDISVPIQEQVTHP